MISGASKTHEFIVRSDSFPESTESSNSRKKQDNDSAVSPFPEPKENRDPDKTKDKPHDEWDFDLVDPDVF